MRNVFILIDRVGFLQVLRIGPRQPNSPSDHERPCDQADGGGCEGHHSQRDDGTAPRHRDQLQPQAAHQ